MIYTHVIFIYMNFDFICAGVHVCAATLRALPKRLCALTMHCAQHTHSIARTHTHACSRLHYCLGVEPLNVLVVHSRGARSVLYYRHERHDDDTSAAAATTTTTTTSATKNMYERDETHGYERDDADQSDDADERHDNDARATTTTTSDDDDERDDDDDERDEKYVRARRNVCVRARRCRPER